MSAEAQKHERCNTPKVCLVCGDGLSRVETAPYAKLKCERCGWFFPQHFAPEHDKPAKVLHLIK